MKAVTIRGVEPEIAEKLKSTAAARGKSINQLAIDLIKEGLGMKKKQKYTKTYDDLETLFGNWNQEEYEEIQKSVTEQRNIDPELWK